MKWPALFVAVLDEVRDSFILTTIFQGSVTDTEERNFRVPTLRMEIVGNTETENYEPTLIRFDIWTRSKQDQIIAESELRRLFHQDAPYIIQGVGTWSRFEGRNRLEGPQDGVLGVAVDYRFEPLRSRYTPSAES